MGDFSPFHLWSALAFSERRKLNVGSMETRYLFNDWLHYYFSFRRILSGKDLDNSSHMARNSNQPFISYLEGLEGLRSLYKKEAIKYIASFFHVHVGVPR